MPEVMTFDSLKSDIEAYIERGGALDTTVNAQIPRLINRCERSIAIDFKVQGYQATLSSTMVAGPTGAVIAKPSNWLQTISMSYGHGTDFLERKPLLTRSYEYLGMYWPNRASNSASDEPEYYADYDDAHWLIAPTPALAYPYEVLIWALPDLLDSANQTNWLTENQPNLLLYKCLYDMGLFLMRDDAPKYQQSYMVERGAITGADIQKIVDRMTTRTTA